MKKFLIVDDHDFLRSGIKGLLLELFKPSEIAEARDGETAAEDLRHNQYDLIMIDI